MIDQTVVVLITTPSPEVGSAIAQALVGEHLAACVNMVPGVLSTYWWEGKVQTDPETLLVVKTTRDRFDPLAERVRSLHPYTVPEIIGLPLVAGSRPYLEWLKEAATPVR